MSGGVAIRVLGHGFWLLAQVWPVASSKKRIKKKIDGSHDPQSVKLFLELFLHSLAQGRISSTNHPVPSKVSTHPIGDFHPRAPKDHDSRVVLLETPGGKKNWGFSGVGMGYMITWSQTPTFSPGTFQKGNLTSIFWPLGGRKGVMLVLEPVVEWS